LNNVVWKGEKKRKRGREVGKKKEKKREEKKRRGRSREKGKRKKKKKGNKKKEKREKKKKGKEKKKGRDYTLSGLDSARHLQALSALSGGQRRESCRPAGKGGKDDCIDAVAK